VPSHNLHTTQRKGDTGRDFLRRISSPRTKLLAARCECLHLIKIDCLSLRLDESAHACTRSELRGASCEDWKSALKLVKENLSRKTCQGKLVKENLPVCTGLKGPSTYRLDVFDIFD
jgi:hypothetical protein